MVELQTRPLGARPLLIFGVVTAGVLIGLQSLLTGSLPPTTSSEKDKNEPCVWCLTSPEAALEYQVSDDRPTKPLKINATGQYQAILGYTVIGRVEPNAGIGIKSFLDQRKILTQYLSLLPESVYHVTIFDIYNHNRERGNRTWVPDNVPPNTFIPMTGFALDVMTKGDTACREYGRSFAVKFTKTKFKVRPGQPLKILGIILHDQWVASLRYRLGQIFQEDDPGHFFHMNLGYMYKPLPDDKHTQAKFMAEVQEVKSFLSGKTMRFLAPEVHVFHDMTCFTPFRDFMRKCHGQDLDWW